MLLLDVESNLKWPVGEGKVTQVTAYQLVGQNT
jgi:hypothetical protein